MVAAAVSRTGLGVCDRARLSSQARKPGTGESVAKVSSRGNSVCSSSVAR